MIASIGLEEDFCETGGELFNSNEHTEQYRSVGWFATPQCGHWIMPKY